MLEATVVSSYLYVCPSGINWILWKNHFYGYTYQMRKRSPYWITLFSFLHLVQSYGKYWDLVLVVRNLSHFFNPMITSLVILAFACIRNSSDYWLVFTSLAPHTFVDGTPTLEPDGAACMQWILWLSFVRGRVPQITSELSVHTLTAAVKFELTQRRETYVGYWKYGM